MATVPALSRTDVEAALRRLRGQLVATPIVGGLDLPGFAVPADLRLKAETLQPSGSLWFRGAMHWAMRQLGRHKGVRLDGSPRAMLALACAAREARIPAQTAPDAALAPPLAAALAHFGCIVGAPLPASGFVDPPGLASPDFVAGIASIALELLEDLPRDAQRVLVAPAALAGAVAAGAAAIGAPWQVLAGPAHHPRAEELREVLLERHRLGCDLEGVAALAAALEDGESGTCVVLGV